MEMGVSRGLLFIGVAVLAAVARICIGISNGVPPLAWEAVVDLYPSSPQRRKDDPRTRISPSPQQHRETMLVAPLPDCVKYSHRPVDHLGLRNVTMEPWMLPHVHMVYLQGNKQQLSKSDGLYAFENYLSYFEGSVTYTWIGILNRLSPESHMVIDGGNEHWILFNPHCRYGL